MLLPPHEFVKPASLAAGLDVLRAATGQVRLMGGGTDVVFNMRCRLLTPDVVVSLREVPELQGVEEMTDGSLRIGAAARLTDLIADERIRTRYPALLAALRAVASRHVRNMATLGGNLCLDTRCWYTNQTREWREARGPCLKTGHAGCHVIRSTDICVALNNADTPPALIALDAEVTLVSPRGERTLPLRAFYRNDGIRHTVLEDDELLARVRIPPTGDRMVYIKQTARQGMDFSYGTIAVRADGEGSTLGRITIVLGSLTTAPVTLRRAPALLIGAGLTDGAIEAACESLRDELGPLTNLYSPAAYKRELARAMLRRALRELRDTAPVASGPGLRQGMEARA